MNSHDSRPPAPATRRWKRNAGRKKFRETRHPFYRGIRERNGGKWVCEVREPVHKARIWLGTYPTPELAARAHDVAALALRGDSAALNFPDSAWAAPRARTASASDIRVAALEATRVETPSEEEVPEPEGSGSAHGEPSTENGDVTKVALSPLRHSSPSAEVFLDEEAVYNMPGFIDSMAEAMLLTPPGWKEGVCWDDAVLIADLNLWGY